MAETHVSMVTVSNIIFIRTSFARHAMQMNVAVFHDSMCVGSSSCLGQVLSALRRAGMHIWRLQEEGRDGKCPSSWSILSCCPGFFIFSLHAGADVGGGLWGRFTAHGAHEDAVHKLVASALSPSGGSAGGGSGSSSSGGGSQRPSREFGPTSGTDLRASTKSYGVQGGADRPAAQWGRQCWGVPLRRRNMKVPWEACEYEYERRVNMNTKANMIMKGARI
eukprot:scaffold95848_cov13-Tisochrysis_lutea.AAC.1